MDRKRRLMENNNGWPLRSQLFDGAPFRLPLLSTAVPASAATGTTATFTRATAKTWQNNDGYLVTGLAGEIGFPGARRVDNLIRLGAAQSSTLAVAANVTMTLPAGAYQFSMGAGTGTATFSGTGGATGTLAASASARTFVAKTISAGTLIVTASVATLVDIQVVSMVAETDQTTPREYVSVGALDYRSELNRLYLSLPGTAGHYASTPDSVANSITGDIDIRVKAALTDWTPAAEGALITKYGGAAAERELYFAVRATGVLRYIWNEIGPTTIVVESTVAPTVVDGATLWVRVTHDVDNGASGNTVTFYTSTDGTNWTQLGAPVVTAGVTNHINSTTQVELGGNQNGSSALLAGRIYQAQIYSTIGGTTPVVDFNPHRDAVTPTGTFTSSTTGEVWTINGASSVIRSAYYHGSGVDGVKCFPTDISGNPIPSTTLLGYSAEGARTNYALWNRDLTNVAWVKTNCTAALTATGADNAANSASTLTATAGNATCLQSITRVSAQRVTGCKIKRRTGTGIINMTQDNGVTWTPVTVTSAYTNVAIPAATAANPIIGFQIVTNGDAIDVDFVMHEEAAFVSSSIATTTIAVARNADVLTYSSAGNIDGTKGWCYAEFSAYATNAAQYSGIVGTIHAGGGAPLMLNIGTLNPMIYDGTTLTVVTGNTATANVTSKAVSSWGGSTMSVGLDGSTIVSGAFDGELGYTATDGIGIGTRTSAGANLLNGNIKNVRIGQRQLSASELQAITQ